MSLPGSLPHGPSPAQVEGYHVYRASGVEGPFTRITSQFVVAKKFVDTSSEPGPRVYMVRAIALQQNPSGNYYNPSQGIFTSLSATTDAPIRLVAELTPAGVALSWNSQAGHTYRVLMKKNVDDINWTDISGALSANAASMNWVDPQTQVRPRNCTASGVLNSP